MLHETRNPINSDVRWGPRWYRTRLPARCLRFHDTPPIQHATVLSNSISKTCTESARDRLPAINGIALFNVYFGLLLFIRPRTHPHCATRSCNPAQFLRTQSGTQSLLWASPSFMVRVRERDGAAQPLRRQQPADTAANVRAAECMSYLVRARLWLKVCFSWSPAMAC